jgi:hypothetical protein
MDRWTMCDFVWPYGPKIITNYWISTEETKFDFFQIFIPLQPGVAKWQHACFLLFEFTE